MRQFGDWDLWQTYVQEEYEGTFTVAEPEPEVEPWYGDEIHWTPTFTYPRSFNNYDAWMAESYSKNSNGPIDHTKGVLSRFAEKEGFKVLRDRYKFGNVTDLNLEVALVHKLDFRYRLPAYDLQGTFGDETFYFDVKARVYPTDNHFYLNLTKIEADEFFLFSRMGGTRTSPTAEIVGYLSPSMVSDYFRHLTVDVAWFPGYFLFNNTLDAFDAYRNRRNPTEVPMQMWWIERQLDSRGVAYLPKDFLYLVNEYLDFSNNQDVAKWKDKVLKRR